MKKGIIFFICISLYASYLVQSFNINCKNGDRISCAILGLMYSNAQDVNKDVKKAVKYYKRACFLKEKNSCFKLYEFYKDKNIKLSDYFLKQACKYNHKKACIILEKNNNNEINDNKLTVK
jgi:TPR repeat protein